MINDAWDRVGGMIPELKMNKGLARAMLNEGEVWLSRMAAMETGDLRVYRFFSLAPGETAD